MRYRKPVLILLAVVSVLALSAGGPSQGTLTRTFQALQSVSPQVMGAVSGTVSGTEARHPPKVRARPVRSVSTHVAPAHPAPAPVSTPRSHAPPAHEGHYGGSVPDLIRSLFPASEEARALCTAHRESRFDPYAQNPHSSAAGVYQFIRSTWLTVSRRSGWGGASVFSARANVAVAAWCVRQPDIGWSPWGGGCG